MIIQRPMEPHNSKDTQTLPRNWGSKMRTNFNKTEKDSPRKSLAPHNPSFYKWIHAQESHQQIHGGFMLGGENCDSMKDFKHNGHLISLREQNETKTVQDNKGPAAVMSHVGYIQPNNTRNIGELIHIELVKGTDGLGFSVTTRDNMPGSEVPVYVKAILPRGPAVRDGRLRSWDRLISVNGVEMTGKTQSEAVSVLREIAVGSPVLLLVSRHTDKPTIQATEMPVTELEVSPVGASPPDKGPGKNTIRVLIARNYKRLGLAVRGKTTQTDKGCVDVGIFIRAIAADGAAAMDGVVKVNDQLVEVNGQSLTGRSNTAALETMRRALQSQDPAQPISLVVARRRRAPPPPCPDPQPHPVSVTLVKQPPTEHRTPVNGSCIARSLESLLDSQGTDQDDTPETDSKVAFSREGFARKSISEKRKGHVDPRISQIYQKIKSTRAFGSPLLKEHQELRRAVSMCSLDTPHRHSEIIYCTRL